MSITVHRRILSLLAFDLVLALSIEDRMRGEQSHQISVLSAVLSRAGHVAVSNRDILDFLLTPAGLLYAGLFGSVAVAFLLLEQAGIMVLVAFAGSPVPLPRTRSAPSARPSKVGPTTPRWMCTRPPTAWSSCYTTAT